MAVRKAKRKRRPAGHDVGGGASAEGDTRSRIVDAARALFWDKGYGAAGMAEILARAKVNAGSFYHFFKGKEDVLIEVLGSYLAMLDREVMDPAFKKSRDPVARIFHVLAGYRNVILFTNFAYGCPLGRLAFELDPEDRPAHALIAANFAAWRDRIAACAADAFAGRSGRPQPRDVAALTLAIMEGGVIQARSEKSIEPFDAAVRELRRYLDLLRAN
jgi:AcrR family transcriptional regulator